MTAKLFRIFDTGSIMFYFSDLMLRLHVLSDRRYDQVTDQYRFLVVSHDSIRGCVRPWVRPSMGHAFFFGCPNLRRNELETEEEYRKGEASRD